MTLQISRENSNQGAMAVDGDTLTRWASNSSDSEWIYVDLGKSYRLNTVKIEWEAALGKNFQIDVSE